MDNPAVKISTEVTQKHFLLRITNGPQTTTLIWCSLHYDQNECYVKRPRNEFRGESTPTQMDYFADNLENGIAGGIFTAMPPLKITYAQNSINLRQGLTTIEISLTDDCLRQFVTAVRSFAHFRRTTPVVTNGGNIIEPEKGG